jgi:putative ABC transport system substrate-binding protein
MSYGADLRRSYRDGSIYVDRILRGAKVSELPVQFATKFELVINLKTARAIGLTIPETFLVRAACRLPPRKELGGGAVHK